MRPRQHFINGQRRCIDGFGKNSQIVLGEVWRLAALAEKLRQVGQLVRPALKRHAEMIAERG